MTWEYAAFTIVIYVLGLWCMTLHQDVKWLKKDVRKIEEELWKSKWDRK